MTIKDPAELMAAINKQFGPGTISTASDPDYKVERWPTGVLPLDHILDGGIPRGRMIECYGPYSTLKSYFLYKAIAGVQRQGGTAALVDTEHSFDPEWATQLGMDVDNLLVSRPGDAEQGIGVVEALVRQRYDIVGFDSIAAAIPRQHAEVAPGDDTQPGALARVMSKGLARVNAANKTTSLVFINQTRQKIGVTFGSPTTTSGGLAMSFYASARLSFTRVGKVTENVNVWNGEKYETGKRTVAHRVMVTLEKSKINAPHTDTVFLYDLRSGEIDSVGYLIGLAMDKGMILNPSVGWYEFGGKKYRRDKLVEHLDAHPDVVEELIGKVM